MSRALSHSGRMDYMRCQRKFLLGRELHLEPAAERKQSLRMGSVIAQAAEHHDPSIVPSLYLAELGEGWDKDRALQEEAAVVQLLAELYLAKYQPRADEQREVEFDHPILGRGALDRLRLDERGVLVGSDDKCLTRGPWFTDAALAIDVQITAYMAAMREEGVPLDRFEYRIQWKPGIKWTQKESLDEYITRLRGRIEADESYGFSRYILRRSDEQLDEFLRACEYMNAERQAKRRKYKKSQDDALYPMNTAACGDYGGCDFLPACRKDPGWQSQYRVKPRMPKVTPTGRKLIEALRQEMCDTTLISDVAEHAAVSNRGASHAVRKLAADGLVVVVEVGGHRVVSLTDLGRRV